MQLFLGLSFLIRGSKGVTEAHSESQGGGRTELSHDSGDLILPLALVTLGKSLPISWLLLMFLYLYTEGTKPSFCLFV